ncbi:MAG: 2Fe-2S ferredoxin, partial [Chloroflexota bacterium]|nr:2Fe-2S ferredoxin [Chloroflexota bacterium]
SIHFTSPGIRLRDAAELAGLCDYVSYNSLGQWRNTGAYFDGRASQGLRVNPGMSFLDDERYDPCRQHSKLGIPIDVLANMDSLEGLGGGKPEGLLVHTNCESTDFLELQQTVDCLQQRLPHLLEQASWINLGGGYLLPEGVDLAPLRTTIERLQREYGVVVFLEPGAAFVRSAGHMVSTTLDIFDSGGKRVAVLDSTVNHMPELLEFDFEPDVACHQDDGEWEYLLAGCTCLAGDVFGEYRFERPLGVGDRVVFNNAGSYTLAKAHTFNGVNLPTLYSVSPEGRLKLLREFDYEDYAARWKTNACHPS